LKKRGTQDKSVNNKKAWLFLYVLDLFIDNLYLDYARLSGGIMIENCHISRAHKKSVHKRGLELAEGWNHHNRSG
jgi:hypothetical protein